MHGSVDGFAYGLVTPLAAYVMAFLGSALGLRCTTRSLIAAQSSRPGWLALGAGAIGSGIWTMHFIAMMGFQIRDDSIRYDASMTFASLGVAVVIVGIGVFIVGYFGTRTPVLLTAGTITGLGVAVMHYLGMAAMRMGSTLLYDPVIVTVSVLIAVVAATAALWAAVQVRGFLLSLGAALIMGVAVCGMHYTGMAALSVRWPESAERVHAAADGASSAIELLVPMMIGPLIFLVLAAVVVMFDPMMVLGTAGGATPQSEPERLRRSAPTPPLRGTGAHRPGGYGAEQNEAGTRDAFDAFGR